MIGVSFQPRSDQFGQQNGDGRPSSGSGVQEAIKILSLRLPRVLGAQPAVSMPLLTSQGSGGNPRIDSIVNQVMSRVMPGQQGPSFGGPPQMPWQPSMGASAPSGPTFTGSGSSQIPRQEQQPWTPPPGFRPRVSLGFGDFQVGQDGRPTGPVPGLIAPLPDFQFPPPPSSPVPPWGDVGRRAGQYGGGDSPFDSPLMF